jgi:cobalt-zinc-cadmium efflux system outer membrane protein
MKTLRAAFPIALVVIAATPRPAFAANVPVTYERALELAHDRAPALAVARAREVIARVEVRTSGMYPNPTATIGTSTQAARLSLDASVPVMLFGQRGAAMAAGRAELATVMVETEVTASEVRAASAHAFVTLWLAEGTAHARADAAEISLRLESAVRGRVDVGSAPELEGLRARAERLRAESDAHAAAQLVSAAAADLLRFIGDLGASVRTDGEPRTPRSPPPLAALEDRIGGAPSVRREEADASAAEARAGRERALARPAFVIGLGVDAYDPTLPGTSYRAQLGIDVPLLNQRGPLIERELDVAAAARMRGRAEKVSKTSDLRVAYETFSALTERSRAFQEAILPAAEAAARATDESYSLGRAPLLAVLDARRAWLDARLSLLETLASRSNAWIEVERATGMQ